MNTDITKLESQIESDIANNEYADTLCDECDGDGYVIYSCCGDDIKWNDSDLCPSCSEHCGMEKEDCEECNGLENIEK